MSSLLPLKNLTVILARFGCTNRHFYKVVVINAKRRKHEDDIVEQLGTFDPLPNVYNEKLVSFDFDRIKYWLAQENVSFSDNVLELLGLSGFLPLHPKTFANAREWKSEAGRVKNLIDQYQKSQNLLQNPEKLNSVEESISATPQEGQQSVDKINVQT